ncbi:hypothetical protein [Georgenia muralis]|uniref:Uncharacterized protein n=1 Tax=Georgenia muralis TaxID=154117 RepID=A0A3N4ZJ39_9MICO|nr:hypothetical protein [Georgenia muralis]RPF25908.1 hypothetical protein EDD32_0322 [Georgenia muralis]
MRNDETDDAVFWMRTLVQGDRALHDSLATTAAAVELDGLRARCASLSAALLQARTALDIRREMVAEQSAALAERDARIEELLTEVSAARTEAQECRATVTEIVGSRRWRAGDALATVVRAPRTLLVRRRGSA